MLGVFIVFPQRLPLGNDFYMHFQPPPILDLVWGRVENQHFQKSYQVLSSHIYHFKANLLIFGPRLGSYVIDCVRQSVCQSVRLSVRP